MGMKEYEQLIENGWSLTFDEWDKLDDYTKEFINYELGENRTKEVYTQRLKALDFVNMEHVVDAACGIGQWSRQLRELNKKVTGVDLLSHRLEIARVLNADNDVVFAKDDLNCLSFENEIADGFFCYGAIMFTDLRLSIKEANRVLKPNGMLYINYNTYGWYLYLMFDRARKTKNLPLFKVAFKMLLDGLHGFEKINISRKKMEKILKLNGFEILEHKAEGMINRSTSKVEQFYGSYFGLNKTNEVLARKI